MKPAYYNEIDPFAAQWLRNLIAVGHIAPGDVDERSVEDVHSSDLKPYTQCHFFAGIGGWPLALRIARLASAPGIRAGSPPFQDNSVAAAIHGRALDSQEHEADWPTHGSTSSPHASPRASASRTSWASARGLRRSPAVWDSLATEYADPNDRLRMLVRLIYAGECGLLPTVVARDFRAPGDPNHPRRSATRGQPLPETFSSPVPAELARWMMGFPPDCAQCMPMETP